MERIEREIAAGRIAIPIPTTTTAGVMYRRAPQHQEVYHDDEDDSQEEEYDDETKTSTSDDNCTDQSSQYSGYQSSEAEWEASVNPKGELIYIDCHPINSKKIEKDKEYTFERTKSRRSTRGKLLRLLRRRDSKRKNKNQSQLVQDNKKLTGQNSNDSSQPGASNKVTFHDCQAGEEREVSLIVDPKNRIKYGRQVTISEAVLGLTLSQFSDGVRIMVAGIVPDSEAAKHRNIKIGDWLKSINDRDVNTKNVNNVLDRIKNPCVVRLKLQRIAGVEVTTEPPPNQIPKQSEYVRQLINPSVDDDNEIAEILCKLPVGVLFLTTEGLSETGPEFQGVHYCYPGPLKQNKLCTVRGAFITLHHLLPDVMKSKVLSTSVLFEDTLTHIIYSSEGSDIFLLALPNNRCSLRESIAINNELIETLRFMHQTLNKCFLTEENLLELDHFFARFFARILSGALSTDASQAVDINDLAVKAVKAHTVEQFENVLRVAHQVPLPRDIQLDIDDCLNDMEACDYREWNEDPMDCQRLYTVIGSCVYHSGYLLGSHLQHCDLQDVHSFCRQQGLLHLFRTESVRSFVLWREIYPASCNRGVTINNDKSDVKIPKGRWFLLIVGYDHDMLAAIFEAGGCTVPAEDKPRPDPFYVEEVQYTLEDIQCLGVMDIARKWIAANIYPQIITDLPKHSKKGSFIRTKIEHSPTTTATTTTKTTSTFGRKPEVTSILKRRSNSEQTVQSSIYSGAGPSAGTVSLYSQTSTGTGGDVSDESRSFRSINSDEHQPIIGRREARERGVPIGDDSESDSEWNAFRCASNSSSSFDLSDIRQALLSEIDHMSPYKITAGKDNVLFHYIKLDEYQGVLLRPVLDTRQCSERYNNIINNFRRCCHIIHKLFQRTLRFKSLLNHNNLEKPIINKSLVAIKEHGVLFESIPNDDKKYKNTIKYWVVGRLFPEPYPRQLYVCYDESIPQNMIEIAFRLGILEAG